MDNKAKFIGELIGITQNRDTLTITIKCKRSDGIENEIFTTANRNTKGLNLEMLHEGDLIGLDTTYEFVENIIPAARFSVMYKVKEILSPNKILDWLEETYQAGNMSYQDYLEKCNSVLKMHKKSREIPAEI